MESWNGLSTHINLRNCDPNLIRNPKEITSFITKLCSIIKMKKYGKTQIKRFGKGDLEGYSAFQFIETSNISIHFEEAKNNAFIDIFSCKKYDFKKAAKFSKDFFKAKKVSFKILHRV
ncbi:S-adenosylmethionine decarboxylase [Candidatus Pacearchaeota archaeon]|nr:S-adenosylmethionine decarboxylase [Candidatus Pacearchaeota archaeon]